MTLAEWAANGWLKKHASSKQEITDLIQVVDRDLEETRNVSSQDWRFGIAYNAALKLCAIALHAEGYRASNTLQHYRTIMAMPVILGTGRKDAADYLDTCRRKRNELENVRAGVVSEGEASELISFCNELRRTVIEWLRKTHPELCP